MFILARLSARLHVARQPFHLPMPLSLRRRTLRIGVCALAACSKEHDINDAALRAADADSTQWLSYGRTYNEQRHSPLQQVDERSVARLALAWSVDFQTLRGLEATPTGERRRSLRHQRGIASGSPSGPAAAARRNEVSTRQ